MRVLVTGAAGFVGRYLLHLLEHHTSHRVHVLGRGVEALGYPPGRSWPVDLRDRNAVAEAVTAVGPEIVVHLAGTTSVAESWNDPVTTMATNILGTAHLLDAIPPDTLIRWINAGSAEEYAAIPSRLGEEHPLCPASPYGTSKVTQEWLLQQMAVQKQFAVYQFRAFNQTGPGQDPRFVVPSLAAQVLRTKHHPTAAIQVGNLSPVRDFLDVRDSTQIYAAAIAGQIAPGTYNLCSGRGRSIREILDDLLRIAGIAAEPQEDPSRFRPVDVPYLVGNPHKLEQALGRSVTTIPWQETLTDLMQALESASGDAQ